MQSPSTHTPTPEQLNGHELARSWVFDVDVVTAKAFKPLPEVQPIAQRCVMSSAQLLIPISEAQAAEFTLGAEQLRRQAEFLYYSHPLEPSLEPSHGSAQRKLATTTEVPRL